MDKRSHIRHDVTLTNSQTEGLERMLTWAASNSKQPFTLKGYAGTGKTFLTKQFIKEYGKPLVVTAPTHKAVRVIEQATNKKGKTIHSLHGLRPNVNLDDFDVDNIEFDALSEPAIKNYSLVIMDECSQINKSLYRLNEMRSNEFGTKILYIGDPAQLPPVKERISPTFVNSNGFTLNEIVRQEAGNPLLEILKMLRYDVENGSSTFLHHIYRNHMSLNDKAEGYVCLDNKSFGKEMIDYFKSEAFSQNVNLVRYTGYLNDNIAVWNEYIRKNLIEDSDNILTVDDLLLGYNTITDEYNNLTLINSEDYMIADIDKRLSDYSFVTYIVSLRNIFTGEMTTVSIVDHKDPSFVNYTNIIISLRNDALTRRGIERSKAWRRFFEFKQKNLCMIDIEMEESRMLKRDIDYGYGVTTHKLQGSTMQHMFVNVANMVYYKDSRIPRANTRSNPYAIDFRNKLLYTAISRASKLSYLLL